jgi:hypothetical protein
MEATQPLCQGWIAQVRRSAVITLAMVASLIGTSVAPIPADASTGSRNQGSSVIEGQLLDEHGAPTAGRLSLIAWPRMDVLAVGTTGDSVKTTVVATGQTLSDGRFALLIDPSTPVREFIEADGTINFTLIGQTDAGGTTRAIARRLDASRGIWTASADGTGATGSLTLRIGQLAGPPANSLPFPVRTDRWCYSIERNTFDNRTVGLNEVYTGPSASGQYVYTGGASSDLGVGFSASGSYGSFSQSGTASASSSYQLTFPNWGPNNSWYHLTKWQYKLYEVYFYDGVQCTYWGYEVRPSAWQGDATWWALGTPPTAESCAQYFAGAGAEKVTNAAQTWNNGVDLQGPIGASLSSKTGWFASSKITFQFSQDGRLCGTNAYPPDAARVVAKGP